jgi:small subunit ribosomal protein S8
MDTISDMLTRIRNASAVKKTEVVLPYSKFKHNLAKVLASEGWIRAVSTNDSGKFKNLVLELKYTPTGMPMISGITRVSKPGQRIYSKTSEIPRSLGGVGTTIVSTSKGLMTDKSARQTGVGGEVICQIW